MLEQITLRDFKAHRETVVPLKPLTILAGPNGAGKTSVLEAIELLGRVYRKGARDVFEGRRRAEALARRVDGVRAFELEARGTEEGKGVWLALEGAAEVESTYDEDGQELSRDEWYFHARVDSHEKGRRIALTRPLGREIGDYWPRLRESTLLRLDASRISSTSAATRFARIARDGSGVATMLANLKLTDDARFHAIVAELSRVVREVQGVRVEPANTDDGQAGYRLLFDMLGGRGIPATSISEGTLVTLALMTLLRGRFPPTLVLLDDVDESLHPTAQARLMAILRDLTEGDSAIQIIATSHSPYILDCVEPEAVQVFALRDDGTVAVKCLADHPEAARSRGTLTAGQLWTLDDEHHWVIDGAALVRILLFCEAEADARTARHLVDEVLRHRGAAWVRETLELDPRLVRRWVTDVGAAQARQWFDLHRTAAYLRELGLRPQQGRFDGKPGLPGALLLANASRIARELDRRAGMDERVEAVVLVWDMDQQGDARRAGLAQGATHAVQPIPLVVGWADPMREAWILAGFEPQTLREEQALQKLRAELGFQPHREPHRLTASDEQAKLHAKRVVQALGIDAWDREEECLRIGSEERWDHLQEHGRACGLAAFLDAIEKELVPRVERAPQR